MKPESVGMCSQRLARIDRFLARRYVDSGRLPCALLQVARSGQLVHQSVLGKASLETGTPLTDDSIVRICSMTKPITSVAIMMLVEQGLVALDDPVHRPYPGMARPGRVRRWRQRPAGRAAGWQTKPAEAPMRIIDLLRHTSGLTYGFPDPHQRRCRLPREQDRRIRAQTMACDGFIDALTKVPLEFSPGTAWNYSVSTDVLGYLVQQDLGPALRRSSCGSASSARWACSTPPSSSPTSKATRLAQCYVRSARRQAGAAAAAAASASRRPRLRAAAGWSPPRPTTCAFANACAAAVRSTNVRLIGPKTLALMRANHLPGGRDLADVSISLFSEATFKGVGFGLGFAMTTERGQDGRWPARWANTGGVAPRPPRSGSTRWRTSASSS